jgi:hypothetical protein
MSGGRRIGSEKEYRGRGIKDISPLFSFINAPS